jgi:hypothetical protein
MGLEPPGNGATIIGTFCTYMNLEIVPEKVHNVRPLVFHQQRNLNICRVGQPTFPNHERHKNERKLILKYYEQEERELRHE